MDRRPIIHLGGPAPTPPLIQLVARIAAGSGIPWLHTDWPLAAAPASRDTTSAKGQSGTGRVQERSDLRKGASSLNSLKLLQTLNERVVFCDLLVTVVCYLPGNRDRKGGRKGRGAGNG